MEFLSILKEPVTSHIVRLILPIDLLHQTLRQTDRQTDRQTVFILHVPTVQRSVTFPYFQSGRSLSSSPGDLDSHLDSDDKFPALELPKTAAEMKLRISSK